MLLRLVMFAAVGTSCLALQWLILEFIKAQGIPLFFADATGFFVSAQVNFLLSYVITWGDTARLRGVSFIGVYFSFIGVAAMSMLLNATVFAAGQGHLGDKKALIPAAFASMCFTFLMNHRVVFRRRSAVPISADTRNDFDSIAWFLPAHCEAGNLPTLVPNIVSYLRSLEMPFNLIIVNDGSSDNTAGVSDDLAKRYPGEVQVVHHTVNRGYSAALRTGFAAALETGSSLIGFCDADNQFDIGDLGYLIQEIEYADAVLGYRVRRADGLKRRLMGAGWHHLSSFVLGFNARDTDCGFKLFRREVIEHISPSLKGEYATVSPVLIALTQSSGYVCAEVGVSHFPRSAGEQSGASLKVAAGSLRDLFLVRKTIRKETANAGTRTTYRLPAG